MGHDDKNSEDAEPLKVSSKIQSECDLFNFFKLSPIVPELREGFDEVSRAEASNMPSLVQASSIKGVFHNHTTASDGLDTLEDMVKAAERLGWSYIGFADHSKASYQANGLSEDQSLNAY